MKFRDRLDHYKQIQREKLQGKVHYIPIDDYFPRLSKFLPGIIPGTGYLVGAASGVSKSKFTRHLFVRVPYDYIKKNPDKGIKLTVILNSLEETVEEVMDAFIINKVRAAGVDNIDVQQLNGYSSYVTSNATLKTVEETMDYFEDLEKCLHIVNINNPTGFYKYVREVARQRGKFYFRGKEVNTYANMDWSKTHWDKYVPNDPNEVVICISDHVWLYQEENGMKKRETLERYSAEYCRRIMNNQFGYITVNVQQYFVSSEQQEFTRNGESILHKIEPSFDSHGDVKTLLRDNLVVLGLFSPMRHHLTEHRGYDITRLKDNYRALFILKNRKGRGENLFLPLIFDGAGENFKELPWLNEKDKLEKAYKYVEQKLQNT